MIEQKRDVEIVKFIAQNPCYTDTIANLFFHGNPYSACRRLKKLEENGYIKRVRHNYFEPFFLYRSTLPKQLKHLDLIAKTYIYIRTLGYEIIEWQREVNENNIRPDAKALVKKNGITFTLYVEVERFENKLPKKLPKYEALQTDKNKIAILLVYDNKYKAESKIPITRVTTDVICQAVIK